MKRRLLEVQNLQIVRNKKTILTNVSFTLDSLETLSIIGPDKSGKGLILKSLMGIQEGERLGQIRLEQEVKFGLVSPAFPCVESLSIFENLALPLKQMGVHSRSVLGEEVEESLRTVQLWQEIKPYLHEKVRDMDEYQKIRLNLARTLLLKPSILLLDKPTINIDPLKKAQYESIIEKLKYSMSVIWVTHDLEQAARVSDKVMFLKFGNMIEFASCEDLFTKPTHLETEAFIGRHSQVNIEKDLKLDQNLHELRALVLTMAGYVEETVDISMKALVLRDHVLLKRVWEVEREVNKLHTKIDNVCFKILACQSPLATDLRLILAIIKMNVGLERMGDLVCNTSRAIGDYLNGPPNLMVQQIRQMATTVMRMLRDCFDAFMDRDLEKAQSVLVLDDAVDEFRNKMSEELREGMKSPIADIGNTMALLSIVRNLERLADHATNISEEVIFYLTGFDVRHKFEKTLKEDANER